jgi:hypothetical protein
MHQLGCNQSSIFPSGFRKHAPYCFLDNGGLVVCPWLLSLGELKHVIALTKPAVRAVGEWAEKDD